MSISVERSFWIKLGHVLVLEGEYGPGSQASLYNPIFMGYLDFMFLSSFKFCFLVDIASLN